MSLAQPRLQFKYRESYPYIAWYTFYEFALQLYKGGMKSVLIVEDNTELQEQYRIELNKRGFTDLVIVDSAPRGLAALNVKKPDLVLLDIMLKEGSNGFDLLEQMKKLPQFSSIPVVMITNLETEEKSAREIGVVDYIVKSKTPIDKTIDRVVVHLQ